MYGAVVDSRRDATAGSRDTAGIGAVADGRADDVGRKWAGVMLAK